MRTYTAGTIGFSTICSLFALTQACSSDTTADSGNGSDASAGGNDGGSVLTTADAGSNSSADSGLGADTGAETGDGGPVVTPVHPTSTCAAANVTLTAESTATLVTTPDENTQLRVVKAVDVNNDGAADLVGLDRNDFAVALSNKDGTFGTPKTTSETPLSPTYAIGAGDFDGDGYQDLLIPADNAPGGNPSMDVLLGKGDGTFKLPVSVPIGDDSITAIQVADFNGDGKLDFYYGGTAQSVGNASAYIVLNAGNGTFNGPGVGVTINTNAITFGDINGDNLPDALYVDLGVNGQASTFCTARNSGGTSFGTATCAPVSTSFAPDLISAGDLNDDGLLDVALYESDGLQVDDVNVFLGQAGGTFADRVPYPITDSAYAMSLIDLNNDKHADLVAEGNNGEQLNVWLANADGSLPSKAVSYPFGGGIPQPDLSLSPGDFLGNGLVGLVTLKDSNGNENVITATCKN